MVTQIRKNCVAVISLDEMRLFDNKCLPFGVQHAQMKKKNDFVTFFNRLIANLHFPPLSPHQ